jgi:hypothetical protein
MGFLGEKNYTLCLILRDPKKKQQQSTWIKKLLHNEKKQHKMNKKY